MIDYITQFDEDKKYIEEFQLESTTGTKKMMKTFHINAVNSRNAFVNGKLEKYNDLRSRIYDEMESRVNALIPADSTANYIDLKERILNYRIIFDYNNEFNDIYNKLNFDNIVNDIDDTDVTDFGRINELVDKIVNLFDRADIKLTAADFDYSMYTSMYMSVYFDNLDKEIFMDSMKDIFDKIYWECPNFIIHLKLCIRNLYSKFKKELDQYYQRSNDELLKKNHTDKDNYKSYYQTMLIELKKQRINDIFLLSSKFLDGTLSIYDYLEDTPQVRKNFNRFIVDREFTDLSSKEKEDFYEEISGLKDVVVELDNYNKYKGIVSDVLSRYANKDSFKGAYDAKLKEIKQEEKVRSKLLKQYLSDSKFIFAKKVNKDLIKVQLNDQIKKLDTLYNELDEAKINDIILNRLDDASTIRDALYVAASFYDYFKKMVPKLGIEEKDIDYTKEYFKLINFVNNPNNTFITKIKFQSDEDLNDIIYEKYKLLNINISKDDLVENLKGLEDSVDFVNLVNNINNSDISIEKIKYIIDFKKIDKD